MQRVRSRTTTSNCEPAREAMRKQNVRVATRTRAIASARASRTRALSRTLRARADRWCPLGDYGRAASELLAARRAVANSQRAPAATRYQRKKSGRHQKTGAKTGEKI